MNITLNGLGLLPDDKFAAYQYTPNEDCSAMVLPHPPILHAGQGAGMYESLVMPPLPVMRPLCVWRPKCVVSMVQVCRTSVVWLHRTGHWRGWGRLWLGTPTTDENALHAARVVCRGVNFTGLSVGTT